MGCFAEYIIKNVLFTVNLVFALGGLVLLVLGSVIQARGSDVDLASVFAIVIGSVIFLIAFFGCFGAFTENRCFLSIFALIMLVLVMIKVTVGVLIFVNKDSMLESILEMLSDTFSSDRANFLEIQSTFSCCGTTGPQVYLPGVLPASCCDSRPCNVGNAFSGCNDVVVDFYDTYWIVIGVIVFVVAAVQLIAAIFGFSLSRHIANKQTVQVVDNS